MARAITSSIEASLSGLVGRALSARASGDGRPFVIGLFVTHRCMCDCASCLWKHNDWKDVPADVLKRFLTEARDQGFVALAISGGEPFLRKDLGEILRFAKEELGMVIMVITTGYFLESRGESVLPWIDVLVLSLDAPTAARHDEIRVLPGLYDELMRGVAMVKQRYPQLSVQFNSCVQAGTTTDHIDDLIEVAEEKGVQISFDVITEFRNAGEETYVETQMGLELDELRAVARHLVVQKRAGAPILNSERYFAYFANGRPGYRCHLPKMCMMVDGRGNIENCLDLENPIANIRDMPLAEIMELPRFKELRSTAEACCTCSSPTMVDMSHVWENPRLFFQPDGVHLA